MKTINGFTVNQPFSTIVDIIDISYGLFKIRILNDYTYVFFYQNNKKIMVIEYMFFNSDYIPVGYFDAIGFNGFESNLSPLLKEFEQILFFELLWIMIDWRYKIFNPIDLLKLPQGERPHKLFFTGS